ncbi:hypothetical protein PYW08_012857 [Mythimna loreyi]|uniref:Uncharacterized protein n=1 Tax=Mythimna loreyi TaxID=667449 RepID=A0ACC2Q1K0_9NEOP|nr:hypothetical protein PYW08_012857 [Mythimna loreyi]
MYHDTSRCQIGKITAKKEALQCFKLRLRRQMIYQSRSETVGELSSQTKIAKGKPKMSCPYCAAPFQCFFKFNMHLREVRKKICRFCYEILDYSDFVEHSKSHNFTVIACPICSETFEKESALLSHKVKHAKGPEECLECHETFANSGHLNKHMNIKHKPIVCGCGKKLPNRVCFFKHKKICNQHKDMKSKFICDYCDAEYKKKNCLKMHIKLRHTVGWAFQCEKCGKQCSSQAHLLEHRTTHEKITDRHVCHCGAKYSSRRGYERHLVKHTKVKKFEVKKGKMKSKASIKKEKKEV